MTTSRHTPDERFRRDPRDWRRFRWGYVGHNGQGLAVCAGLGFAALPLLAWQVALAHLHRRDRWPSVAPRTARYSVGDQERLIWNDVDASATSSPFTVATTSML